MRSKRGGGNDGEPVRSPLGRYHKPTAWPAVVVAAMTRCRCAGVSRHAGVFGAVELKISRLPGQRICHRSPIRVAHRPGSTLSATSLVRTFDDLPKPVFTTVLRLELNVERPRDPGCRYQEAIEIRGSTR